METLDQRILIPARPEFVWDYVSHIENNPDWQIDCQRIVFLTQKHQGPGARWRHYATNRREHVYEITAWYDGLGYEYRYVDGSPYKASEGRIRLQEIAEGTVVQWTFRYELGGLFGGIRAGLGAKRRLDNLMVESLKTLWKQTREASGMRSYQARSLIREAPDADERAAYQSRHKVQLPTEETEPPIEPDDTRPRPAAEIDPAPEDTHSRFAPPDVEQPAARTTTEEIPHLEPETPSPKPDTTALTPSLHDDLQTFSDLLNPQPEHQETTEPEPPAPASSDTESSPSPLDTAEVSIWEVFGVPSPTETQRMRALQVQDTDATEAEPEDQQQATQTSDIPAQPPTEEVPQATETNELVATPTQTAEAIPQPATKPILNSGERTGLRLLIRRRMVRLKRPGN